MEKNTITLAKYLLTKGIESSLKIQKMLFFFHVEELSNKLNYGFFKPNNNFQAWIYGPVNVESFFFMYRYFNHEEEKEIFYLEKDQVIELDNIYGKLFDKYSKYSDSELIEYSRKNKSWINARGDLGTDEICKKYLVEDKTFIEFNK